MITPTKRWQADDEVSQCPICNRKFEGNFLDITLSGRTHCRFCGGVFCNSCCNQELYMPEDEVVRPPASSKIKSMIFDPFDKHKTCRNCAVRLIPQQGQIIARRQSQNRPNSMLGFNTRKTPTGPYFTIVVVQGKGLVNPYKAGSGITDPVCLLTMGNTSNITQPTQSGSNPVWDQTFDFRVNSEHGNTLKLTCYEEQGQGKELIGEGSARVMETGLSGVWIPVTDDRKAVTGEVLVRCFYKGPRSVIPPTALRAAPNHATYSDLGERPPSSMPLLRWMQENAWVIYVLFLGLSALYRYTVTGEFTGEPIPLRPGSVVGNNKWVRSSTHFIHLQKDGNLVVQAGLPGSPSRKGPIWQSGKPFADKDCLKCVASLDKNGDILVVKDGRKVLKSFVVEEDKWLRNALAVRM